MMLRIVAVVFGLAAVPATAFDLQGHRGTRGLAPENTLPAFARALSLGVDTLELDVGVTKDGAVVIAHDRRLNPDIAKGPNGAYVTAPAPTLLSLTLDDLRRYDVGTLRPDSAYAKQFQEQERVPGTRVPTLAELAALVRKSGNNSVRFNVETKLSPLAADETLDPERFAAALVAALRETGLAARSVIQSFDWRTLKAVQKIAPEIPTVCLTFQRGQGDNVRLGQPGPSPWLAGLDVDDLGGSVPRLVEAAGCKVWSPFFRDLTPAALAEARQLGLKTIVWTVNEPADMAAMLDQGVDGIITDYPDRLRALMPSRGLPLPRPTPVEP
jgi:glycerophosphoryl diester phosphodiesterase